MALVPLPDGMLRVVDLSSHQPPSTIDYSILAAEIDAVILRAAYGTRQDQYFLEHVKRARDVGLSVGAYQFFRHKADQLSDPIAQADTFNEILYQAKWGVGDSVPWLDFEPNERWDGRFPGPEAYNASAETYQKEIEREWGAWGAYFAWGIWASSAWFGRPAYMASSWLWIADFGSSVNDPNDSAPPGKPRVDNYPELAHWTIHQWGVEDYAATVGKDIDWDSNAARSFPVLQSKTETPTKTDPPARPGIRSDVASELRVVSDAISRIARLIE